MPLSEEELRLLEQMERALVAEDPKFASALRGTALRKNARRRSYIAAGVFLVGVTLLMAGAVAQRAEIGIVGFVIMLGSAVVALTSWRSQNHTPESAGTPDGPDSPERAFGLSVIEGGKKAKKKRQPRGHQSGQSMIDRFEERWRRRREGNGGY